MFLGRLSVLGLLAVFCTAPQYPAVTPVPSPAPAASAPVAVPGAPVLRVSAECGPGYSKPAPFARCRADAGHSLLRGCSFRLKPQQMAVCLRQRGGY